ncbi:MAG: hypothetical protein HKN74_01415 [Acidimicrobiia bacterium]|nr:hypothetical protein [Acidimicrobiia bacterium]
MSVDTHLQGKRLGSGYKSYTDGTATVLVAHSLMGWAYGVRLETSRGLFGKRIKARVDHKHRPT